jgi:hypothetical protein
MKKLLPITILGGAVALSFFSGARAQTANPTPTPTPAPPVQGTKVNALLYVDTVQGAAGKPAPAVGCSQTNLFKPGQQVVFRVWGINVKAGGTALTPKNVKSAVVNIPGMSTPLTLNYGSHGRAPNPIVSFWSAAWVVDAAYPMGVVDFTVVMQTKADKKHHLKSFTVRFTQASLAPTSRLTITP